MAEQEITGLGSYSRVAAALNQHYALQPPVDRRRVLDWYERQTLNAAGQRPPEPAAEAPGVQGKRKPRFLFDIRAWIRWMEPGIPTPRSNQYRPEFETPAERNARYARARAS